MFHLLLSYYSPLCLPSERLFRLSNCQKNPQFANIFPSFIIYSQRWVLLLLQGVGFLENWFSKAPCLRPPSPQSWRQGPAELMIRRIYDAISVSHLLPESQRIKGKISGWHWDRDYPVCAIWLQTSTGYFFFLTCLTFSFVFFDLWETKCTGTNRLGLIQL